MKKIITVSLLLLIALNVTSQTYQFSHSISTYSNLAGATILNGVNKWDDTTFTIPIGFTFTYRGVATNSVTVDSYGYLDFSDGNDTSWFAGFIADLKDRGTTSSLSPISYKLTGTTGNHILIVEFNNCGFYSGSAASYVNFQIWVKEADNSLETHMGPNDAVSTHSYDGETGPLIGIIQIDEFNATVYALTLIGAPSSPTTVAMDFNNLQFLNGTPTDGQVYRFAYVPAGINEANTDQLLANIYPNPLSSESVLNITLLQSEYVVITLQSITGQVLETLVDDNLSAGNNKVKIKNNNYLPGIYFLNAKTTNSVYRTKVVVQ